MLKDHGLKDGRRHITEIMPTFYMDEADANREDKPRLDFVVTFNDRNAVRYHPKATPVWLPDDRDQCIVKRRNRLIECRRTNNGRAWHRAWTTWRDTP